ncbi:uracil-DNA glycosylase [Hasllibacter halocynthiae]|uniref:Uracil-DNA glycosylase n=1 Tax=Hasllibacter halocynthiae TaxID=595589 RepID=A0A2T0X7Y1_9RHOB|nr:uracil-DNA glycosylase [Hasllibacter halocynthiae]PRY95060.1 uracil-DNA glycosylase [Hasllibacter halocynthiae]
MTAAPAPFRFDLSRLGPWRELPFFSEDLPAIAAGLAAEARPVLPAPSQVFAALEASPPDAVRVLILGQDPYPTRGHAHGYAFSVAPGAAFLPPSLRNVFREIEDDLGCRRSNPDLSDWARQGVLLLNTALTVPEGVIDGHRRLGWQRLTAQVLARLSGRPRAAILWGRRAQGVAAKHLTGDHLRIETAHPSPLAARKGFFGSRPFSQTNDWLAARGLPPVDWCGT